MVCRRSCFVRSWLVAAVAGDEGPGVVCVSLAGIEWGRNDGDDLVAHGPLSGVCGLRLGLDLEAGPLGVTGGWVCGRTDQAARARRGSGGKAGLRACDLPCTGFNQRSRPAEVAEGMSAWAVGGAVGGTLKGRSSVTVGLLSPLGGERDRSTQQ